MTVSRDIAAERSSRIQILQPRHTERTIHLHGNRRDRGSTLIEQVDGEGIL